VRAAIPRARVCPVAGRALSRRPAARSRLLGPLLSLELGAWRGRLPRSAARLCPVHGPGRDRGVPPRRHHRPLRCPLPGGRTPLAARRADVAGHRRGAGLDLDPLRPIRLPGDGVRSEPGAGAGGQDICHPGRLADRIHLRRHGLYPVPAGQLRQRDGFPLAAPCARPRSRAARRAALAAPRRRAGRRRAYRQQPPGRGRRRATAPVGGGTRLPPLPQHQRRRPRPPAQRRSLGAGRRGGRSGGAAAAAHVRRAVRAPAPRRARPLPAALLSVERQGRDRIPPRAGDRQPLPGTAAPGGPRRRRIPDPGGRQPRPRGAPAGDRRRPGGGDDSYADLRGRAATPRQREHGDPGGDRGRDRALAGAGHGTGAGAGRAGCLGAVARSRAAGPRS
jgi:hypothetical protein